MSYVGTLLTFTKVQRNVFSIAKYASESANYFSMSSSMGLPEDELTVTTSDSNIWWTITGVPDTRVDETKESLLVELQLILLNMGDATKALLRGLKIGEQASQLISGTCFTANTQLKLCLKSSNPAHYSFFGEDETLVESAESAVSRSLQ